MVKLESFNASLYRNFIYCESNYDSVVVSSYIMNLVMVIW